MAAGAPAGQRRRAMAPSSKYAVAVTYAPKEKCLAEMLACAFEPLMSPPRWPSSSEEKSPGAFSSQYASPIE